MFPAFPPHNFSDNAWRDAEYAGEIDMKVPLRGKGPNRSDSRNGEFSLPVLFAHHSDSAPFGLAVSIIVSLRSCKKMGFIAAWRVVAVVKNIYPIGNRSVGECPNDAVSVATKYAVSRGYSVSLVVAVPRPRPAGIVPTALINPNSKGFFKRRSFRKVKRSVSLPSAVVLAAYAGRKCGQFASDDRACKVRFLPWHEQRYSLRRSPCPLVS